MGTQNEKIKRDPYKIELAENVPFNSIASSVYISSSDLMKLVNELFRGAFADFEGSVFETARNAGIGAEPTVSLFFNHGKYEDQPTACERSNGKNVGNALLDRTRNRDRQIMEGDRYIISEDGKDVIAPLLTQRNFNNGNPNWKLLVGDFVDTASTGFFTMTQAPQYTKISGLSINKLCSLIYGEKLNGKNYEYDVKIAGGINTPWGGSPQLTVNYMLIVNRVDRDEVAKVYEKLGYNVLGGSRIVRD